jgi:hypothetical protein
MPSDDVSGDSEEPTYNPLDYISVKPDADRSVLDREKAEAMVEALQKDIEEIRRERNHESLGGGLNNSRTLTLMAHENQLVGARQVVEYLLLLDDFLYMEKAEDEETETIHGIGGGTEVIPATAEEARKADPTTEDAENEEDRLPTKRRNRRGGRGRDT